METTHHAFGFLLVCCLFVIGSGLKCRDCMHQEVVEGDDTVKEDWNNMFKSSGMWNENCHKGGNQGDEVNCDDEESVPENSTMYCVSSTTRMKAVVNDTKFYIQAYARGCDYDEEDEDLGTKYANQCVDAKKVLEEESSEDEDDEDVFDETKITGGEGCFCDTGDSCNDGALDAVAGQPPSFQAHLGLALVLAALIQLLI